MYLFSKKPLVLQYHIMGVQFYLWYLFHEILNLLSTKNFRVKNVHIYFLGKQYAASTPKQHMEHRHVWFLHCQQHLFSLNVGSLLLWYFVMLHLSHKQFQEVRGPAVNLLLMGLFSRFSPRGSEVVVPCFGSEYI